MGEDEVPPFLRRKCIIFTSLEWVNVIVYTAAGAMQSLHRQLIHMDNIKDTAAARPFDVY